MPELPEVETIMRLIAPEAEGQKIEKIELHLQRLLLGLKPAPFMERIKGQTIVHVKRRAKYIVFELNQDCFIIHLGMTGQLTFSHKSSPENPKFVKTVTGLQKPLGVHPVDKHTHLIVHLKGGKRILFRDPRTFGKIIFIPGLNWAMHPRLIHTGPEPLTLDIPFFLLNTKPWKSLRPIKALIMDQNFVAGVGNIYADEALFRSLIHPQTLVKNIRPAERQALLEAAQVVLQKGIDNNGTSFSDYRKPDGSLGSNYEKLMVYGRGGQPCRLCKTILKKIVVAQRGTVFCPKCQGLGPKLKSNLKASLKKAAKKML